MLLPGFLYHPTKVLIITDEHSLRSIEITKPPEISKEEIIPRT
jgi:hypothetical protein